MIFYKQYREEHTLPAEVLYRRRTGPYGEGYGDLKKEVESWVREQQLPQEDVILIVDVLDNPFTTAPEHCRYDVCVEAPDIRRFQSVYGRIKTYEGGLYLIFEVENSEQAMKAAWMNGYYAVCELGYMMDPSRPIRERYTNALSRRNRCELCYPIHEK